MSLRDVMDQEVAQNVHERQVHLALLRITEAALKIRRESVSGSVTDVLAQFIVNSSCDLRQTIIDHRPKMEGK